MMIIINQEKDKVSFSGDSLIRICETLGNGKPADFCYLDKLINFLHQDSNPLAITSVIYLRCIFSKIKKTYDFKVKRYQEQ